MAAGYSLFDTALGYCGIAWRDPVSPGEASSVIGLHLPEATVQATEERIAAKARGAKAGTAPPRIGEVIRRVCRHLQGEMQDFQHIALDVADRGTFAQQVYAVARTIAAGRTMTYGQLAAAAGRPGAARAVGQALGRNPIPLIIPCHRVLAADGRAGGFSAHGGGATKGRLLKIEGVRIPPPVTSRSPGDLRRSR